MHYINNTTHKHYYGGAMTMTLQDGSLWSGVPTSEQLESWGYEIYIPPYHEPSPDDTISPQEALDIITNGE